MNASKNKKVIRKPTSVRQITVYDQPLSIKLGLSTLNDLDKAIDNGYLVSEVGPAEPFNIHCYPEEIPLFRLRSARTNKIPSFIFGSCDLGDTYSAFRWLPSKMIPSEGASIVLDPILTEAQVAMFKLYKYISYDVTWIIHVPAPLGTGLYLKLRAPEIDLTTDTRGIRFKPSGAQTIAVQLPYSNDLSLVPLGTGRPGQCGGSLVLENIEDNNTESVQKNMSFLALCCVHNVRLTGFDAGPLSATPPSDPALNFQPLSIPPPTEYDEEEYERLFQHMDDGSGEVTAEIPSQTEDSKVITTDSNPLAPPITEPVKQVRPITKNSGRNKSNVSQLGAKWIKYQTITLDSGTVNDVKIVEIDPARFTGFESSPTKPKGEAYNLPFKRHVWVTGHRQFGYVQTAVIQVNIARPPQISGVIAIRDSTNQSSVYFVQFGEKKEIPLIPVYFDGKSGTRPRDWCSPWMRTDRAQIKFSYELIAFNRTADISQTKITINIRLGHHQFQVPIKPQPRIPPAITQRYLDDLHFAFEEYDEEQRIERLYQHMDRDNELSLSDDATVNPENYITPFPALIGEATALHTEVGEEENLDLDEFQVKVFDGNVTVGQVTEIPLNLPGIADIDSQTPLDNPISQKFQRFVNIIPDSAGPYGPVVGDYTIKVNLPTTIKGELNHVCLPGDMSVDAVKMVFGLSSILGMAGSALSAIGGPLVSGIVNTVGPLVSGLAGAVGGKPLGDLASSLIGNLGLNSESQPTVAEQVNPLTTPNAITGPISISRFVEMLKPILANYNADPVLPTLLVQPNKMVGYDGEPIPRIPMQVFANMRNTLVEREAFDRTFPQSEQFVLTPTLIIDSDSFADLITAFCANPLSFKEGTRQNDWFKRFLYKLRMNRNDNNIRNSITIKELREIPELMINHFDISSLFGAEETSTFGDSSEGEDTVN